MAFIVGLLGVFSISSVLFLVYGVRALRGQGLKIYETFMGKLEVLNLDSNTAIAEMNDLFESYLTKRLDGNYHDIDRYDAVDLLKKEKYLMMYMINDIEKWMIKRDDMLWKQVNGESLEVEEMKDTLIKIVGNIERLYENKVNS